MWGPDGIAFPDATNNQYCGISLAKESCRIWDWSLATSDTGDAGGPALLGVLTLPAGSDTFTHTWSNLSTSTALRNAIEILDDNIGNNNGLCESDETCLYTPNIGSYQGHGNLISAGTFTDGTLTGITLIKYETNGR